MLKQIQWIFESVTCFESDRVCKLVCSLYSVKCVCSYTSVRENGRACRQTRYSIAGLGGGQERLIHAAIVAGVVQHSGLWRTLFTHTHF